MLFLDGEMTADEKLAYEAHVAQCEDCARELKEMGRVVNFTSDLRLREPDEVFWETYWRSIYRRLERRTGFFVLLVGLIVVSGYGVFKAVTSPEFWTFKGLGLTAVFVGLIIVFLSVVRERYHEAKTDPYKEVKQ